MGGCPGVHGCSGARYLCEGVWKQAEPRAHCGCLVALQSVTSPTMCFGMGVRVMDHRNCIMQVRYLRGERNQYLQSGKLVSWISTPYSPEQRQALSQQLCFSVGLTQAVHIHVTVPGSCGLGRAYVRGAGGAGLSTACSHHGVPPPWPSACPEQRKSCRSSPDTEGNDPDPQQTQLVPVPQRHTGLRRACEHSCRAGGRGGGTRVWVCQIES